MSDKLFDSFIQGKMQDHISPVPGDMWQRIMNEKDRNDKVFWYRKWYAVAALLLLMLGSGATYYYFTANGTAAGTESVETASSKSNNNTNNPSNNNSATTITENQNSKEGTIEQTTDNTVTKDQQNNLSTELKNPEQNDQKTFVQNTIRFDREKPNAIIELNKKSISVTDQSTDIQNNEDAYESKHYSMAQIVSRENNYNNSNLANYLKALSGKGIPITACPSEKGMGNRAFYLEAYVSPDYNWKKTTGTNTGFINTKDSAEKIQASFTAGFRLVKPIGNHVMLKAGLQYSQINEKFQVRQENERKTVTVITTHTIQTSPGVFNTVSDTSSYEQIGYATKTSINKYKNLDVPLLLSYEWGNENIKFAVTGGSIINIKSTSKGETIDSTGATYTYDKTNSAYKTKMGVGVYGSLSIIKPISDNTEIFAEPYVRYNLSNMAKENAGFTQKINSAGINLGVRINIGRQRY